jgi:hypothetical protein
MSEKDPLSEDLNQQSKLPQVSSGLSNSEGRGRVKTNWQVSWTRKKLIIASILLGFPYLFAIIATALSGIYLITGILIGVGILVAILFQVTRWIDRDDSF